jgi:hypothetical protein
MTLESGLAVSRKHADGVRRQTRIDGSTSILAARAKAPDRSESARRRRPLSLPALFGAPLR